MPDPRAAGGRTDGRPVTRAARLRQRQLQRRRALAAWLLLGSLILLLGLFMAPTVMALESGAAGSTLDTAGRAGVLAPGAQSPVARTAPAGQDARSRATSTEAKAEALLGETAEPPPVTSQPGGVDAGGGHRQGTDTPAPLLPVAPSPSNGRRLPADPSASAGSEADEADPGPAEPGAPEADTSTGAAAQAPERFVLPEGTGTVHPVVVYPADVPHPPAVIQADTAALGSRLGAAQQDHAKGGGGSFDVRPVTSVVSKFTTSQLGIGVEVEVDGKVLTHQLASELEVLGYPGPSDAGVTLAVIGGVSPEQPAALHDPAGRLQVHVGELPAPAVT